MIRLIRSKYKLEFFIANWSYSYDLKIYFATYQRMRANIPSWAVTRPMVSLMNPNFHGESHTPPEKGIKLFLMSMPG